MRHLLIALALVACQSTDAVLPLPSDTAGDIALIGAHVVGIGPTDIAIQGGMITAVGEVDPTLPTVDLSGHWLVPSFIDSHVHLAYLPQSTEMATGGIVAAIDLASPRAFLSEAQPITLLHSGPMVTAVGGYPVRSWGANGYGWECANAEEATLAVQTLHSEGARLIKLPITGPPVLETDALLAATEQAHSLGLPVCTHAMTDGEVQRAREVGVDVLAHTPTQALASSTAAAWEGRAVITTLSAFGGSPTTLANLALLKDSGAKILYGTDFGNSRTPGIDPREIDAMVAAGLSPAEILASGTSTPAAYWGLDHLGGIATGKEASLLVLDQDPLIDPAALAHPSQVVLRGHRIVGGPFPSTARSHAIAPHTSSPSTPTPRSPR